MSASIFRLIRLAGGHAPDEGSVALFAIYLDDSDSTGSSVVTLAGYVQPIDKWDRFEKHAEAIYQKYGVDRLHGIEFHNTRGCFKDWSYVRKRNFIDELYANSPSLLGISHSIKKASFNSTKNGNKMLSQTSPYGAAFNTICGSMIMNDLYDGTIRNQGISFIVEAGHKNNRELLDVFEMFKRTDLASNVFKSIAFAQKDDCKAIQLADLNAFYSRRQSAKMASKANLSQSDAGHMEEKLFSLIGSQCQHVLTIGDYASSPTDIELVNGVQELFEISKENPQHIVSPVGRPGDP